MHNRTALYETHVEEGARIVDFGGWEMPLHYGSQVQEHHQVRQDAGMFDVSHMTIVDVSGFDARPYLRRLLANDVGKLSTPGKALYSCMLNDHAGVVDDLIVYHLSDGNYRIVANAATRAKDLPWMHMQARAFNVELRERDDLAMIGVQGPNARVQASHQMPAEHRAIVLSLESFTAAELGVFFVARTGYTGEDGFEIMLRNENAVSFWNALKDMGVQPAGLGARDTLRLEAGMNLYGTDMDEDVTPLECGLGWTVSWDPVEREFIGRNALETQRSSGPTRKQIGLILEGKGVLRAHQKVIVSGAAEGEITSGTFSPTLRVSIAIARVSADIGDTCEVEVRGKRLPARVVKPPFVRHGKPCL